MASTLKFGRALRGWAFPAAFAGLLACGASEGGGDGGGTGGVSSGGAGGRGGGNGQGGSAGGTNTGGGAGADAAGGNADTGGNEAAVDAGLDAPAEAALPTAPAGNPYVYVGATSDPNLRVYSLDLQTGALSLKGMALANEAPNYLAVHPSRKFIYVTSQITAGRVVGFAIDAATGLLSRINDMPCGGDPAHISLHKSGKWLLVANYFAGNASVLPVADDGRLGQVVSTLAAGAEAHMAVDDGQSGNYVFVPSKGSNKLNQFKFDPTTGKLSANSPASLPEGGAPRHIAFHRSGQWAYLLTEGSRTVVAYNYDPAAGLLSPLTKVVAGTSGFASTIVMHPSKDVFYAGVRGPDTITTYAIDAMGRPQPVGQVDDQLSYPWDFSVDATGKYLVAANNTSASIKVFRLDPQTGTLTLVGGTPVPAAVRTVRIVYPP
jgi:6-phosphogluconolactonase